MGEKCWKAIPLAPKMLETDFMNYRAVLDLDGTAWSERFARLLCYNSVVIRIEVDNDLEEYSCFDGEELQPHVHYLPATLKNCTLVASRAAQNKSRVAMERIITNANLWCRTNMVIPKLNQAFASVVEGYVSHLDKGDLSWRQHWAEHQHEYFGRQAFSGHGGFTDSVWPQRQAFLPPSKPMGLEDVLLLLSLFACLFSWT